LHSPVLRARHPNCHLDRTLSEAEGAVERPPYWFSFMPPQLLSSRPERSEVERPPYWLSFKSAHSGCPTLSRTLRKGGVSSKARPLSYTPSTTLVILNAVKDPCIGSPSYHPKSVISTGAQRSGETPVLALLQPSTIRVPYPLRTLQRVGYRATLDRSPRYSCQKMSLLMAAC